MVTQNIVFKIYENYRNLILNILFLVKTDLDFLG